MKRITSISFLSLALLVLTALSFVSHHHHRTVMCTAMEFCEADLTFNDRHTAHDYSGGNSDEEGCVTHASFTPANQQTGVATPDAQVLQAIVQVILPTVPSPAAAILPTEYNLFILAYNSVSPNPGSGLRAPPSLS